MPRGTKKPRTVPSELTARICSYKRNYFIGHMGVGSEFVDDEAILDVEGVIERTSPSHSKHIGETISFRLIHSERYAAASKLDQGFSGSITLRGKERCAYAYLPREPFWGLPAIISSGADMIDCSLEPMRGGHGDLMSFYVGKAEDLEPQQG